MSRKWFDEDNYPIDSSCADVHVRMPDCRAEEEEVDETVTEDSVLVRKHPCVFIYVAYFGTAGSALEHFVVADTETLGLWGFFFF